MNNIDISNQWNNCQKTELTAIDVFSGAGGLSKGFELAGINVLCGADFFKEAVETHKKNFSFPIVFGDVRNQDIKEEIYSIIKDKKINIVAGGFPCQGFSMSGKRVVTDQRNSLYLEMLEMIKHIQPDFIVFENVPGLLSMLDGKIKEKIIEDCLNIGYNVEVQVLNSANYYVPQLRKRVIFIGNKISVDNNFPAPLLSEDKYKTIKDALFDIVDAPEDKAWNHVFSKHTQEMKDRLAAVPEGKSLYEGFSDAWRKSPWNEPSCTVKGNHGGVNIHPILPRVMTQRELARLQSFPDDFIFYGSRGKQFEQIGNAVPVLLGKAIGLALIESFKNLKNYDKKMGRRKPSFLLDI